MGLQDTASPALRRALALAPLLVTAAVLAVAVVSAGLVIHRVDDERRDMQMARIDSRHGVASEFLSAYVRGLAEHQAELAAATLSGPVTPELFDRMSTENGYSAAVLLDRDGILMAVSPPAPQLLGKPLPSPYRHLDAALAGTRSASDVVLSAATQEAVIAIAVPFDTAEGRRVFSPGHRVSETPLAAFTSSVMSLSSSRVLLVDSTGTVITSSDPSILAGEAIGQWPEVAATVTGTGLYDVAGRETFAVAGAVVGTPWQLVFSVEVEELLAPVSGPGKLVPWGILAAFTAASVVALLMWRRAQHERQSRVRYERKLHHFAMSDALTGLGNRRVALDRLQQALHRAQRMQTAVAVLYIDVDRFKQINDRYGHGAGDAVLTTVADRLRTTFRTEDTIVRLGGDEFAVICEGLTDLGALDELTARTRTALGEPYPFGDMLLAGSASVGVAAAVTGDTPEAILARADGEMYAAKGHASGHVAGPIDAQTLGRAG